MKKFFNRRSIRLPNYDYSQNGSYFVTVCTQNREYLFGEIVGATRGSPDPTRGSPAPVFQRNYYEHIIRDNQELLKIREYIKTNPLMWERDRNNFKL